MIKSLSLEHFRGFRKASIAKLDRINLITGNNNVGKTAVLEALWLLFAEPVRNDDFVPIFRPGLGEYGDVDELWRWLFFNREFSQPIRVWAGLHGPQEESVGELMFETSVEILSGPPPEGDALTISRAFLRNGGDMIRREPVSQFTHSDREEWSFVETGRPPHSILSIPSSRASATDVADMFSRAVSVSNGEETMESWLRLWDNRLLKLRYLKLGNRVQAYAELAGLGDLIPITQLGAAVYRLVHVFSSVISTGAKIILIDEVENGLHHSGLAEFWTTLMKVARERDIQIFATTHSAECIASAQEAAQQAGLDDCSVHRVQRVGGELEIVSNTTDVIDTALKTGIELR